MIRSTLESVLIHLFIALVVLSVVYAGTEKVMAHKKTIQTVVLLTSTAPSAQPLARHEKTNIKSDKTEAKAPNRKEKLPAPQKPAPKKITPKAVLPKQTEKAPAHTQPATAEKEPVPAQTAKQALPETASSQPSAAKSEISKSSEQQSAGTESAKSSEKQPASKNETGKNQQSDSGRLASEYSGRNFNYILALVRSNLKYPYVAKMNKWTGKAVVQFDIAKDGNVSNIRIVSSSGHSILDEKVKAAVSDSAPFPHPPVPATIVIPVVFNLIG